MRLALCCKEGLFGDALSRLLDEQGTYQVVVRETSAKALVTAAKDQYATILVIDSEDLDSHDLQFVLGARAFGDFAVVLIVDEAGRHTFADTPVDRVIPRSSSAEKLFEALGEVSGFAHLPIRPYVRESRPGYAKSSMDLTRRELECAQLVAKGLSNRKIAEITGLREQSTKNLVSVVMRKLGCENRVQVALRLVNQLPRTVAPEDLAAE